MPGQSRRQPGTTPPPFPTPDELTEQQRAEAAEEVGRLRKLVGDALAKYDSSSGSSCSVVAEGFSEVARRIVFDELRRAQWSVERGGQRDMEGEFFVSPARRY